MNIMKKYITTKTKNENRIKDYDIIQVNEPPITGIWIFLNTGHCLFHHTIPNTQKNIDDHLITGLLSSISSLFEATQNDKCNIIFGFDNAYYYNYTTIHDNDQKISIMCVISTSLKGGFSPSDVLMCNTLTLKSGQLLLTFVEKYIDDLVVFNGRTDKFKSFSVQCMKIIRS